MPLNAEPKKLRNSSCSALLFPHVVVGRGLFADAVLDEVPAVFPRPEKDAWRFENRRERKLGGLLPMLDTESPVGPFHSVLNSAPMLEFLEQLTGIGGLTLFRETPAGRT